MVRISNPVSSKLIFAATRALMISAPLVYVIWHTNTPDLWDYFGYDKFFESSETGQSGESPSSAKTKLTLTKKYIFHSIFIFPFTFLYALKTIPKKLVFTEANITATCLFGTKSYLYSEISDTSINESDNGVQFLKIKLGKRKIILEVDDGQVRQINKYIPVT